MKNFELFMGCLSNGLTVCNKAVEEHGDYKQIAHISPAGNIKWYIPVETIPGPDLLRIEHTADCMYQNFKQAMEQDFAADRMRTYFRILDCLNTQQFLDFIYDVKNDTQETKIEKLKALYLKVA